MSDETLNFTPLARQALSLAREEAARLNHNFTGTEHLLLGLIRLGQGTAVTVFGKFGVDLAAVRAELEKLVATGPDQKVFGNIPYTPRVKTVLALAAKEAKALHHSFVGTEHILLGLLREGDGLAARLLKDLKVDRQRARQEILKELDPNSALLTEVPIPAASPVPPPTLDPKIIDITRHYDVYCREGGQEVIYRNALFKGIKRLLAQRDLLADFLELKQGDGQAVFVARASVVKFCESETKPKPESPADQPPSAGPARGG